MIMKTLMVIQGRNISSDDIRLIRCLISRNPSWHRTRLSRELCKLWNWYTHNGRYKDMACRSLLLKLEKLGHICLPARRIPPVNSLRNRSIPYVSHKTSAVCCNLSLLGPIQIETIQDTRSKALFKYFISHYHYLGYPGTVGENMKYLVSDRSHNPLACLLFGSAAYKIAPRDTFIGWDEQARKRNLHYITNNMRFLVLPWVKVLHLASHILGRITRCINADWMRKYNHPLYLLETFVDCQRFRGVCYKAGNWSYVGKTQGRTRNDPDNSIQVPIKDVYVYPLTKNFRGKLSYG